MPRKNDFCDCLVPCTPSDTPQIIHNAQQKESKQDEEEAKEQVRAIGYGKKLEISNNGAMTLVGKGDETEFLLLLRDFMEIAGKLKISKKKRPNSGKVKSSRVKPSIEKKNSKERNAANINRKGDPCGQVLCQGYTAWRVCKGLLGVLAVGATFAAVASAAPAAGPAAAKIAGQNVLVSTVAALLSVKS